MSNATTQITIPVAANAIEIVPIVGKVARIYASTGDFDWGPDRAALVPGREDDILTEPFRQIVLRDKSGSANSITIIYGDTVPFSRSNAVRISGTPNVQFPSPQDVNVVNASGITGTFTPEVWDGITHARKTLVATTAQNVSPATSATPNKRAAIIKNPSSASASVFLGADNSVTDADGFELEPGESVSIPGNEDIYAYSVAGQDITVLEVTKA